MNLTILAPKIDELLSLVSKAGELLIAGQEHDLYDTLMSVNRASNETRMMIAQLQWDAGQHRGSRTETPVVPSRRSTDDLLSDL